MGVVTASSTVVGNAVAVTDSSFTRVAEGCVIAATRRANCYAAPQSWVGALCSISCRD